MYTQNEYEADLAIQKILSEKYMQKDKRFYDISMKNYIVCEKLNYDFRVKLTNDATPNARKPAVKRNPEYTGDNVRLLKRSSMDLKKLRTTIKLEKGLDEDDDFSSIFLGLWPQFEFEFRNRFYETFIPSNHSAVMDILRETHQDRDNVLSKAENPDFLATFGLINEVIYAIEYGCRRRRKRIMEVLSKILQGDVNQFFLSYSLHNCFKNLNATIRRVTVHQNKFLDDKGYHESCMLIFNKSLVREWIRSGEKNMFTDYLKLLPESYEEKGIFELEKSIRKIKMAGGTDNEVLSEMGKELELLKMEVNVL